MIPGVPVTGVQSAIQIPSIPGSTTSSAASGEGFGQFLSNALDQANQLSNQADNLTAQFVAGGHVSVDQLMIAQQKASLAVDLVVQVRNRVVSAYQSVMNMQI